MVEMTVTVGVVMGLAEAAKRLGFPAKFVPLLNIGLGLAGAFLWSAGAWQERIFNGLAIGLTASGLFSGAKNVVEGIHFDRDKD